MFLSQIQIQNFKAIENTTLRNLSEFNVIVGTNGSGKSSVLQALHWILQSVRNPSVASNGSTLSVGDADYLPSPNYKNSSYKEAFGNFATAPKLEVALTQLSDIYIPVETNLWLKAARNEGLSVHYPANSNLVAEIRQRSREVSSYIPGLAGIPLSEAKLSKRVVHRLAAAGDANTVLRNLLFLLKTRPSNEGQASALDDVVIWVSKVLGDLVVKVGFDDEDDFEIGATFRTNEMQSKGQPEKPLELAGIGFLQVIQIFAYLVYYQPRLLLVDEPDSHLHPQRQEALVRTLHEATAKYDCQVIMTSHSPNVARALPNDAKLIWMKEGDVVEDAEQARAQMGWGLLDKKVILLTEDRNTGLLQKLIAQWPEVERKVAVWPLSGLTTLPSPDSLAGMRSLFGGGLRIALHRDGDFLNAFEREKWSEPYISKGVQVWITEGADVEAYWAKENVLDALGVEDCGEVLTAAIAEIGDWEAKLSEKRGIINSDRRVYPGGAGTPSNADVVAELAAEDRTAKFVGKMLCKKIRGELQNREFPYTSAFGKTIPEGSALAPDLRAFLEGLLR